MMEIVISNMIVIVKNQRMLKIKKMLKVYVFS